MADTATLPREGAPAQMTLAEFLTWEQTQELRHELVQGRPRAMTGGTQAHNIIAGNVYDFLRASLKAGPCRPFIADLKVIIAARGHVRYPDVLVDCAPVAANDTAATNPTLIVEVLSKSTAWFDQTEKMDDYAAVPSIAAVILLHQDKRAFQLWTRDGQGLMRQSALEGEAVIPIEALSLSLPLDAAYEGLSFESAPS